MDFRPPIGVAGMLRGNDDAGCVILFKDDYKSYLVKNKTKTAEQYCSAVLPNAILNY